MMLHAKHMEWIEVRGIDPELALAMGLDTVKDRDGYWLTVPYTERGETINRKYRQTAEKRHRMDAGAPLLLWNVDALSHPEVLSGSPVIITEGEWDALAAMTTGFLHVVSVPNGAPAERTDRPEEAKRYEFIWRNLAQLDPVKSFILATDDDQAGRALAADLASLLGADRCRFVVYPEGCKDLNEVLLAHGTAGVTRAINGAKAYPVAGLFNLADFPPERELECWQTGIRPLDGALYVIPGTLTVFTGYANIGKSTVLSSVIAAQIKAGRPVCVAPFETSIPILRDSIRQAMLGCTTQEIRQRDTRAVDDAMQRNLSIIYQSVDEDEEMNLDRFLELCRVAVVRDGARMIVLDPWNELEHKRRRDETETEYTNRALRAMRRFADRYQVAFWIVAHPAKPMPGTHGVPKGYQISGSAAWANKPHYGLTYHRRDPSQNSAELHVWKVKQGLPGKKTEQGGIKVALDFRTWEFIEDKAA
jgi:twinkle protein